MGHGTVSGQEQIKIMGQRTVGGQGHRQTSTSLSMDRDNIQDIQGDQLNMAVFLWYLVNSDL